MNLENESNPVHPIILLSVKMNEVRISSNLVQKHLLKNTDYTKFSTKILWKWVIIAAKIRHKLSTVTTEKLSI